MKILCLDVVGFRSLREVRWEPSDLNVLIGPNGSGKSNLLRTLEMIRAAACGTLGDFVRSEGGMDAIRWDGRVDSITLKIKASPVDGDRPLDDSLTYTVTLEEIQSTSAYRIRDEILGKYDQVEIGKRSEPFKFLERRHFRAHVFDEHEHGLVAPEESLSEEETLLSLVGGPYAPNRFIPPFKSNIRDWSIYQYLRVDLSAEVRKPALTRLERRLDPDGQNLVSVLHTLYTTDRDFKRELDDAMSAAFSDDYEELVFQPASDQRIELRVRWRSLQRAQSARDLSDGTLRFLMLVTLFSSPDLPPLIGVDEPEAGLHPSMLPIVAEHACAAAEKTQVILTTHSPNFLDGFRDFAVGTEVKMTVTVAEWKNGRTELRVLNADELSTWLQEYSMGSLFESGELESMA